MYFLRQFTHTCVRTHQGACVFLSERHSFFNLYCGKRGSSTDCILNVVAQQKEAFSLDLAENIVLRRARPTSSRHKGAFVKDFFITNNYLCVCYCVHKCWCCMQNGLLFLFFTV